MNKSLLGYNLSECKELFDLSKQDLSLKIIGFGDKIDIINSEEIVQKNQSDQIPFDDGTFDLALMLYDTGKEKNNSVDEVFVLLKSLARVAKEVRVLVWTNSDTMTLLGPLLLKLQQENYRIELKPSQSTKSARSKIILRIWPVACVI